MQIPIFLCFSKNDCESLRGKLEKNITSGKRLSLKQIEEEDKTALLLNCEYDNTNCSYEQTPIRLKCIYFIDEIQVEETEDPSKVIVKFNKKESFCFQQDIYLSDEAKSFLKEENLLRFPNDEECPYAYTYESLKKEKFIELMTLICIDAGLDLSDLSELIVDVYKQLNLDLSDLSQLISNVWYHSEDLSLPELIADVYKQLNLDLSDLSQLIADVYKHQEFYPSELPELIVDVYKQLNLELSDLPQLIADVYKQLNLYPSDLPQLIVDVYRQLGLELSDLSQLIADVYKQLNLDLSDLSQLISNVWYHSEDLSLPELIVDVYKQLNLDLSDLSQLIADVYKQLDLDLSELITDVYYYDEDLSLSELIANVYRQLGLELSDLSQLIADVYKQLDLDLSELITDVYRQLENSTNSNFDLFKIIAKIYEILKNELNQDLADLLVDIYKKLEDLKDPSYLTIGVYEFLNDKPNFSALLTTISSKLQVNCVQTMVKFKILEVIKSFSHPMAKQIVLYGPPGTGKTKLAQEIAKLIILDRIVESLSSETLDPIFKKLIEDGTIYYVNSKAIEENKSLLKLYTEDNKNISEIEKVKREFEKYIYDILCERNIEIVQLHPSYSYEDFIRSIHISISNNMPHYEVRDKVFAELCKIAETNREQNFVLIIDEINRANLPLILGELIYALEYRNKEVETPYGKIKVPENLYIIATMNTADRSVVDIDYAIRRRFTFFQVKADGNCIKDPKLRKFYNDVIDKIFDPENSYLSYDFKDLYDDVKVGHTYFLGSLETVAFKFVYQVIPLLIEYVKDGVLTTATLDFLKEYFEKDIKSIDMEDVKNKVNSLDISDESQK